MATHSPYLLNLIPPLPMGNPFPFPSSHTSSSVPQFPFLRAATSSAPQQAQSSSHLARTQIPNLPHIQPPFPTFRAPAHKHAHHLHSIPPREKSTRTLIIDHMLWVHARTRLAQARAELGMTDRTGGPSSSNHAHRRRPENYDEEEDALSEGEDNLFLKSRTGWITHDDDADHLNKQDLALARDLRLRAEGLESVISSMLDQPPPHHPTDDDNDNSGSPISAKSVRTGTHPHTLPNGVRLRLALGTVINDLFARQAPPQPYRHTHPPKQPEEAHPHPHHFVPDLPEVLLPLIPLSGAFALIDEEPQASTSSTPYNTASVYTSQSPSSSAHIRLSRPPPSARTAAYYASGADPLTANSPPSLRCPRHLYTGCEICVEARSTSRPTTNRINTDPNQQTRAGNTSSGSAASTSTANRGIPGWQDGSGIGSGLLRPGIKGNALRRRVYDNEGDKSTGAGNTKLSKLIPRFLRLSALVAAELGQEARDDTEWTGSVGSSSSPPSPVFPPGTSPNQSKGKDKEEEKQKKSMLDNALRPTREWYLLLAGLLTRAVLEGYLTAGWRGSKPVEALLLVGIGLWSRPVVSSGMGGNIKVEDDGVGEETDGSVDDEDSGSEALGDEEEFAEFDPDGLPSLTEAVRVLFPGSKMESDGPLMSAASGQQPSKGQAEAEYEVEIYERLRRFYDIPEPTPDLSTHMEDLAWSYPAEPVERAAVRFCEAVAKWRGKPELESYKKAPSSPGMPIDSLVRSNPSSPTLANAVAGTYSLTSLDSMLGQPSQQQPHAGPTPQRPRRQARKPSIDVYFSGTSSRAAGMKRGRDERGVEGREEGVKRTRF